MSGKTRQTRASTRKTNEKDQPVSKDLNANGSKSKIIPISTCYPYHRDKKIKFVSSQEKTIAIQGSPPDESTQEKFRRYIADTEQNLLRLQQQDNEESDGYSQNEISQWKFLYVFLSLIILY